MFQLSTLSRKNASCSDLLRCVFGIKDFEERLIYIMARRGRSTLDDLASETSRDRSTVHRALSKLLSLELCYRNVTSLRGGGYIHEYSLMDVESIGRNIRQRIDELKDSLDSLAENFENDIRHNIIGAVHVE
jgi:predicted transcriptional regulator